MNAKKGEKNRNQLEFHAANLCVISSPKCLRVLLPATSNLFPPRGLTYMTQMATKSVHFKEFIVVLQSAAPTSEEQSDGGHAPQQGMTPGRP